MFLHSLLSTNFMQSVPSVEHSQLWFPIHPSMHASMHASIQLFLSIIATQSHVTADSGYHGAGQQIQFP